MGAEERRKRILKLLSESARPLTGSDLARILAVSRQVVVSDMAILRAAGGKIIATPQGYALASALGAAPHARIFGSRHTPEETEDELLTIVDYGGKVVDVTVEHPVYGELRGWLNIGSREDVRQFIHRLAESDAKPLLTLTEGVHLHRVEGADAAILDRIETALREKGYLLEAR